MVPLGMLLNAFWAVCLGAIGLYVFFLAIGAVAADDVVWMSIAAGVLAIVAVLHFEHVRRALGDHEHDELARKVHGMREHRGF